MTQCNGSEPVVEAIAEALWTLRQERRAARTGLWQPWSHASSSSRGRYRERARNVMCATERARRAALPGTDS